MFNPSVYTQYPDHYSEQQIQQESDIFIPNGLQLKKMPGSIYNVDIIDPNSEVSMRVTPNGNYIWEDETTNTVYQVNGIAGGPCQFNLKMIDYEYCNKLISPVLSIYDGTYNTALTLDEMVVRQPNNIYHFDALEGQKQTVFPVLNYGYNDYEGFDEINYWYQGWSTFWYGGYVGYYFYGTYPTSFQVMQTNADFRHNISFSAQSSNYSYYYGSSPIFLFSKYTNLYGLTPVAEYTTELSYLSPYVSLYFPPGTKINYQNQFFLDDGQNEFGIYSENISNFVIAGATFDGYSIILRPYCFSYTGVSYEPNWNLEPVVGIPFYAGLAPVSIAYDCIAVPRNYSTWPWVNDAGNKEFTVPYWGSYDRITGQISSVVQYGYNWYWYYGWQYVYGNTISSFPYKKAAFYLTQQRPIVDTYYGNYCKYTYKNVIISYGRFATIEPLDQNDKGVGKFLQWHSRGVVVDVEVFFKRKPFPDISSIPNINLVKKFIAYPQNVRPLEYRELSYKFFSGYPDYYYFSAYKIFESPPDAIGYVYPYEMYYQPNNPFPSYSSSYYYNWPYYVFGRAIFEYAFNGLFYGGVDTYNALFVYYDPNYDALIQPFYHEVGPFNPCVISCPTASNIDKLAYLNHASFPDSFSYSFSNSWSGNMTFEYNGENANMLIYLASTPSYPTTIYSYIWTRYDFSYTSFDKPQFKMNVTTISGSKTEFIDAYVMHDKFAERGFGEGWFQLEMRGRGSINVYDPNGNKLVYYDLKTKDIPYPTNAPTSDKIILPYFYGNFLLDEVVSSQNSSIYDTDIYWFYSSERSYSVYQTGVFAGNKPKNRFKPFGTYYQGYSNNNEFCTDGIYLITDTVGPDSRNINSSFSTLKFNSTSAPSMEVLVGAFYIDTSNSGFNITPIPLYYVPNIDWSKPYSGCVNANLSFVTFENQVSGSFSYYNYYYYDLEGKPEVYVKSTWWDNIEDLVLIFGPNDQQLVYGVDYTIVRVSTPSLPGNYKIKFLKTLGDLFDNESTGNPAKLADGQYKFFFPKSKQNRMDCSSWVDNYSSLYKRSFFSTNGYYYFNDYYSEFYTINGVFGQFSNTGTQYYDSTVYYQSTISNSYVLSLSPISFYIKNCVFSGTIGNQQGAFKCDMYFLEYLENDELPVNPEGYNEILNGSLYAQGGYDY